MCLSNSDNILHDQYYVIILEHTWIQELLSNITQKYHSNGIIEF